MKNMELLLERIASSYCGSMVLSKPLNINGFTYSTNGHLMLRVKALEKYKENTATEKEIEMFTSIDIDNDNQKWVDVPKYKTPEKVICYKCDGVGKIDECDECEGSGEVNFNNGHNSYEFECQTCGGFSVVPGSNQVCDSCYGEKMIYAERFSHIDTLNGNGARIGIAILDLIKDLPEIKITIEFVNKKSILYLKFNGGRGCFMPMTK